MKAKVDQDLCVGSQDCVNACPEVFKMQGEKAVVYVEQVPKEAQDKCRTAADGCPAGAISLENEDR
jgi:ferredoxin